MNLDWGRIKDGFKGFENLAVAFVNENELKDGSSWKKTKDTQDKNHDALLVSQEYSKTDSEVAIFVGYSNDIDIWWMEAKYSKKVSDTSKLLTRYRLDATIVSVLLSRNISKVVFVTNMNIASKTIWDIRNALIHSKSCREVCFYIQNHVETWILNKEYNYFKKYFNYSEAEYIKLNIPQYRQYEELSFYNIGDNYFQEPLNTIYSGFSYEICFAILVQNNCIAKLKTTTNLDNIPIEAKELSLKPGSNHFSFYIKIPNELAYESISDKDIEGEYKNVLPIFLLYKLENLYPDECPELTIIPNNAVKIISSDYFYLNISSQDDLCNNLFKDTIRESKNIEKNFTLMSLSGQSGIGKSFLLDLYKKRILESGNNIICNSFSFSGNEIDDIRIIRKVVFNLLFPFIPYIDIDVDYVNELQIENPNIPKQFWDFIKDSEDIDCFMIYKKEPELIFKLLPYNVAINNRVMILDDFHKLDLNLKEIVLQIIKVLIQYQYPVYCIISLLKELNLSEFRFAKKQRLKKEELVISKNDVKKIFEGEIKSIDITNIEELFGSVIEIVYFIKYMKQLNNEIEDYNDFKIAYNLFKTSDILKNEITSKFVFTFKSHPEAEELCSCIYYATSGIHMDFIVSCEKSRRIVDILLDSALIKKNDNDFYVPWHDYYKDIYIKEFPLKPYEGIKLPFQTTYGIKMQLDLEQTNGKVLECTLHHLEELYALQKFYSIYYILENIFSCDTVRLRFKDKISSKTYYLLFAYFCYANTNAGTIFSSSDKFSQLYTESNKSADYTIQTIHYIALWELINSAYENDLYSEVLEKINMFKKMSQNIQQNWVYLFDWDYPAIKYAVSTIELFMDSENGKCHLKDVPSEKKLPDKDVAFSTYRLLLCNLVNDFPTASTLLRRYNTIVKQHKIYDPKTRYMYNFAVKFLDCIDNLVSVNEVIDANNLLKSEFLNDYNRHIFAISALAIAKGDVALGKSYRMEFVKTNRPIKKRQEAFQSALQALIFLSSCKKDDALFELNKEMEFMNGKEIYINVIRHNIKYLKNFDFSYENIDFYFGNYLCANKYYIDIRMLY